jgi:DNA-binding CsgD family transcriptional regulator
MSDFVNFLANNEKFLDIKVFYNVNDNRYTIIDGQSLNAEILIPISIFRGKSCGRTLISYLKSKGLSFSDIARILNRNPRTIWTAYKKSPVESYFDDADVLIPVEIFSYRGFSILESMVFWLKSERGLNYSQMAQLLGKNYQTVRTVYLRALKKIGDNPRDSGIYTNE